MAYFTKEQKKIVALQLKNLLGNEWRFTLAGGGSSTARLTITRAPVDLMKVRGDSIMMQCREWLNEFEKGRSLRQVEFMNIEGFFEVNPYYVKECFASNEGVAALFLSILETMKGEGFVDDSDSQSDYFHCSHYINIQVGSREKRFMGPAEYLDKSIGAARGETETASI